MATFPDLIARLRFLLDDAGLRQARSKVDGFAKDVEHTGLRVDRSLTATSDQLGAKLTTSGRVAQDAVTAASTAVGARLGVAGGAAEETLQRVGTQAVATGGALKVGVVGGAVAGGAALTAFAAKGVADLVSLAGEVRAFQRASGASAEDSSRFVAVLDDLGISADVGANAVFQLLKRTADGGAALAKVGVQLERTSDGGVDAAQTILNVADAFAAQPDPAKRAEIAFAAFGRQGKDMIPILERGREGLAEFWSDAAQHGQLVTDEELAQVLEMELALDEAQDAVRGLGLIAARALVPFLTDVGEATAKVVGLIEWVEQHGGGILSKTVGGILKNATPLGPIGDVLGRLSDDGDEAASGVDKVTASVDGLAGSVAGVGAETDGIDQLTAILDRLNGKVDDAASAFDRRRSAVLASVDAEGANRRAMSSFADAVANVADKERALTVARRSRADATRDALDVERSLNSVEDAQASIKERQRDLEDAQRGRGPRARELLELERELVDAQHAYNEAAAEGSNALRERAQAAAKLADVRDRLDRARSDGGQSTDVAEATEAISRARLDAREAALTLSEARERTAGRDVEAAAKVKEAEAAVFTSREQATAAAVSSAKAAQELAEQRAIATGVPLTVTQSYSVFRDKLIELKDTLAPGSPVRKSLEATIDGLADVKSPPPLVVKADVTEAVSTIRVLGAEIELAGIKDGVLPIVVRADVAPGVAEILGFADRIDGVKQSARSILIGADASGARAELETVRALVDSIKADTDRVIAATTQPVAPEPPRRRRSVLGATFHEGGFVDQLQHHRLPAVPRLSPREVPAVLEQGEFVIRRASVAKIGIPALERLNRFHEGGLVNVPELRIPELRVPELVGARAAGGSALGAAPADTGRSTVANFNLPPADVYQLAHEVVRLLDWENR